MVSYKTNIDGNGRIVIPAKIRKAGNLSIGQSIVINVENDEVKIIPYNLKLKNIQNIVQHYTKNKDSLVYKLARMRREELNNKYVLDS